MKLNKILIDDVVTFEDYELFFFIIVYISFTNSSYFTGDYFIYLLHKHHELFNINMKNNYYNIQVKKKIERKETVNSF